MELLQKARSLYESGEMHDALEVAQAACEHKPKDAEAWWLLESDRSALMLVDRAKAGDAWRAIESAGRPFGLSCVGQEASRRYAVLERSRSRAAALVG